MAWKEEWVATCEIKHQLDRCVLIYSEGFSRPGTNIFYSKYWCIRITAREVWIQVVPAGAVRTGALASRQREGRSASNSSNSIVVTLSLLLKCWVCFMLIWESNRNLNRFFCSAILEVLSKTLVNSPTMSTRFVWSSWHL